MGEPGTHSDAGFAIGETPAGFAIGETPIEGGFRRVSHLPPPLALARLRALVLDVAAGSGVAVAEGLAGFEAWRFLGALAESAWASGARRDSMAARRVLARRLRMLGSRPISVTAACALPVGSAVHLRGQAQSMLPSRLKSHIWAGSTRQTDTVRVLIEEGYDFLLMDGQGGRVKTCVLVAGGHLINADRLADGASVSVFGTIDRVADARAAARSPHGRGELALAVRSTDALPLLVRSLEPGWQPTRGEGTLQT